VEQEEPHLLEEVLARHLMVAELVVLEVALETQQLQTVAVAAVEEENPLHQEVAEVAESFLSVISFNNGTFCKNR
jgi:hypothetical protein